MFRNKQIKSLFALADRLGRDRRGVSAVITAIALTTLAGFCGLAVDVTMWEVNQRALQGAADQAALAAVTAFRNAGETSAVGDSTTAQNAAYATAIRNGYPAGSVTVVPYNNGGTCTNDGCIEVTINQSQSQYFTAVFFNGGPTATASAVATCNGCGNGSLTVGSNGGDPCVMALDSSGKGVITDSGGATLSLTSCNLYNNSPQTDATVVSNNAVIEGCSATNACGSAAFLSQPNNPGNIDIPVTTNSSPAPDPYANVTPPTVAGSCSSLSAYQTSPGVYTNVPSGTYCGGGFQNANVTFQDHAVIVVSGGLQLTSGSTTFNGTNVMMYVTSDGSSSQASKFTAQTTFNITAPTDSQYAGIGLWFEGTSQVTFNGSNASSFKGAIYAPQADVSYAGGNGTSSTCTRLVAASITLTGNSTATFSNNGCPATAGPVLTSAGTSTGTNYTGSPMLIQ